MKEFQKIKKRYSLLGLKDKISKSPEENKDELEKQEMNLKIILLHHIILS